MMIYEQKSNCYGCTACLSACPVKAIKMIEDEKGFLYPKIDEEKCIKCGLCKKICPYNKNNDNLKILNAFAVKNVDEHIRSISSSGGVFSAMADYVLNKNGIVVGAILDENLQVKHVCANNENDVAKMRGSKYVQSNMTGIFPEVKKYLEKNITVLFTGTPCQCAGLKCYLRKDYENLYICDLICHGASSPRLFRDHIKLLNKNGKVLNYNFRSKINGWHNHTEAICYENNEDFKSNISQSFKQFFGRSLNLRESCYTCKFANMERVGDITIGDFWGVEEKCKEFDDNKGINLLLINNERGRDLFNNIEKKLISKDVTNLDFSQQALLNCVNKPKNAEMFWKDYFDKGYDYILNKYTRSIFMMNLRKRIKKIIKR